MNPYQRVLVPLDGSELSTWVLSRAEHLLRVPGLSVTLLRVVESSEDQAGELAFRVDPRHGELEADLARLRDELVARAVAAQAEVRFGDPAGEILREAASGGYDLVAMTTHGRTGLGRVMFGSVALKVLQASPIPLLLFRPLQRPDGTLSPVETVEAARFRRILVPLDESAAAEEILPHAETLARTFGSKLCLFSAIPGGADEAVRRADASEYLGRWQRLLESRGLTASAEIRTGLPFEEAARVIRENGLDAVALTTHGRTGMARAMYGSVAEKILCGAGVPVLALRNGRGRPPMPSQVDAFRHVRV
jgi:nucleotide-binding universal stress UspA family protein